MTVIAVVSTAGGAGRTTICSALAVLLARRARQVFAIELDAQNILGAYLGLEALAPRGLVHALLDSSSDWHAESFRNDDGVMFVPYGALDPDEIAPSEAAFAALPGWLAGALGDIDQRPDAAVLIDAARYPSQQAEAAMRAADLVLCVTTPEPAGCVSLASSIDRMRRGGAAFFIVVNQLHPTHEMHRDALALLRARVGDGVILPQRLHRDAALPDAFARGVWVFDAAPHAQISHDLHGLARWLDGWLSAHGETA
ncbi:MULTISPECIES: cellulose biosynthesis protein BcsQ [unclassified Caballeronia]|uniref:cellulose biosynthesis protein BcsQ n=1 Tax=unclassified Caballeronia TaxID=2646786 RepID=UPI002857F9F7|nr:MULTISPECIES: cellulose biosynthesis protein BcsQ [unclassified Caballeronia]MDR5740668.1 cellulose biosynthesis protein BcsQ [Caballeronia sp. LZ016]MDR5808808.1 cellulose biosynthesis protein BcsQ [Caballeronia sp. LZ019]